MNNHTNQRKRCALEDNTNIALEKKITAATGIKTERRWRKCYQLRFLVLLFITATAFGLIILTKMFAQHDYAKQPVILCSIRTKTVSSNEEQRIRGVALLKNELYIISRLSSTIEVYASTTCRYIRQFTVNELADPEDIVANVKHNTLFISHWLNGSGEILNIDVNGDLLTKWRTRQYFGHLFVTASYNIILSALMTKMFIEYTADGDPLNIVEPDKDVSYLSHVVKLSSGFYLVSHGYSSQDPKHGVCMVDSKGRVIKSFGRSRGWTTQQMNVPYYLAVDRHGTVFVADSNNMRVMLLSSELEYKRILLSEKDGIRFPYRMVLDETNGRLIIVDFELRNNELKKGQVLVFDILQK